MHESVNGGGLPLALRISCLSRATACRGDWNDPMFKTTFDKMRKLRDEEVYGLELGFDWLLVFCRCFSLSYWIRNPFEQPFTAKPRTWESISTVVRNWPRYSGCLAGQMFAA
jgi:hypothetical protein